jgi:hypothetical protein
LLGPRYREAAVLLRVLPIETRPHALWPGKYGDSNPLPMAQIVQPDDSVNGRTTDSGGAPRALRAGDDLSGSMERPPELPSAASRYL